MPTTAESLEELLQKTYALFADKNRFNELKAKGPKYVVSQIYKIYNNCDIHGIPNWYSVLRSYTQAFQTLAGTRFELQQRYPNAVDGQEIVDALKLLMAAAKQNEALIAKHKLAVKRPSLVRRKKVVNKLSVQVRDAKARDALLQLEDLVPPPPAEGLVEDPYVLMDNFLWCSVGRAVATVDRRVYVTPLLNSAAQVFVDFARQVVNSSGQGYPADFKMSMPGPNAPFRNDRIVIYCAGDAVMEKTLEWLRDYQIRLGKVGQFESNSPKGTLPVAGLIGVAISKQPVADAEMMHSAGITRVPGMSFGMSRAAVAYLALAAIHQSGDVSYNNFKNQFFELAEKAGLDIQLSSLAVS